MRQLKKYRRWGYRMSHKNNGENTSICWVKRGKRPQILTYNDKMVTCKFCLKIIDGQELTDEDIKEMELGEDQNQEIAQ